MSANSWMQTPTDYFINAKGQYETQNFWGVVFNPSFISRFLHMLLSCYLSAALLIMGISAYYMFQKRHQMFARTQFNMAWMAVLLIMPIQIFVGHHVGAVIDRYQPVKIAAIEGIWKSGPAQPTLLFAWPDQKAEQNHYAIGIPKLASYLVKGSGDAYMTGLDSVPATERPWVFAVFWSFRIMVGAGLVIALVSYLGLAMRLMGKHLEQTWYLIMTMLCSPLGLIALEMGWMTAEMGRQPWLIYGLLKTKDAISAVPSDQVLTTLLILIVVYGIIFGYFYFKFALSIIAKGPFNQTLTPPSFTYLSPHKGISKQHHNDPTNPKD